MKNVLAVLLFFLTIPAVAASFAVRPEVPISDPEYGVVPSSRGGARIATDGDGYLVVWTDYRAGGEPAVWAARMRADGTLIDRTGLRVSGRGYAGPVVWTGSKYLIAYDEEPGLRTYVRTMTRDAVFGEPIEIANGPRARFGAMATNGTNVLLVHSEGAVLLDLEGNKRRNVGLTTAQGIYNPRVAAAGSTYLVALALPHVTTQTVSSAGEVGAVQTLAQRERFSRVGLATDGDRFLVVWPDQQLKSQFVGSDGTPVGTPQTLTTTLSNTEWPAAVWRDGEYFVTFSDTQEFGHYSLRVNANATAAGEPKRIDRRLFADPELAARGRSGIAILRDLRAGVFDDGSVAADAPFRKVIDIPIAARPQANVHLARLGNGYVAAWEENEHILLSTVPGMTPVQVVGSAEPLIDVLVDRNEVIWVVWGSEQWVAVTRYTPTLQPIDPAPVYFQTPGTPHRAAAVGDGVVALSYEVSEAGDQDSADIAALLLRDAGTSLEREDVLLTTAPYHDGTVAVAFDGAAFVYGWVHLKGEIPEAHAAQPHPESEIVGARLMPSGDLLDPMPVPIASSVSPVYAIEAARGAGGVAFAWQVYAKSIQGALFRGPVRDFGGEGMHLGALASHDGGFLLVRGDARRTPEPTAVEYLVLGADLSVNGTGTLPPYEADAYWKWFDIDVAGGGEPVFAYARSATDGRYGHVSRVFVRRTGDGPPRRRAIR